jgi:hypothetical protein
MQVEGDAEVKSKFDSVGAAADELGEKTEEAGKSASTTRKAYLETAAGIGEVSIAAFELYSRFDDLQKGELRIAEAEKNVDSARASLLGSQAALNRLVADGVTGGIEFERATLRVDAAQQQLSISQEKAKEAQSELAEAHASFAIGTIPTTLSGIIGIQNAYSGLRNSQILSNIQTVISEKVLKGATLGTIGHRIATVGSTVATHGLATATKLLHLAMGPVGLAIIGISTFLALFATNSFGVRDAVNAMGKAIGDAIPVLRPLLDTLASIANTIFPEAKEETEDFSITTMSANQDVMDSYSAMQSQIEANATQVTIVDAEMAKQHTEAFQNLNKVTRDTSLSVAKSLDDLSTKTEKSSDRISKAASKAAAALRALSLTSGGSSKDKEISGVKKAASGFSGLVTEPTLFLAGEAGPETVNISPVQAGTKGATIVLTSVIQLDGRELARTVNRYQGRMVQ